MTHLTPAVLTRPSHWPDLQPRRLSCDGDPKCPGLNVPWGERRWANTPATSALLRAKFKVHRRHHRPLPQWGCTPLGRSGTRLEMQPLPVLFLENPLPTWYFLGWPTKRLCVNPYLRISWGGGSGGETKSASSIAKPSASPSMCASYEQSLIPALSSSQLSLWMPRRAWQKDLHLSHWPEAKSL